jgi:menaquinone-dependent protoporphyrinogen oxidase
MTSCLIIYASRHGHTGEIARRLAESLHDHGIQSTFMADVAEVGDLEVHDFDAVIVGSSVHMGRHDESLVRWVAEHHVSLQQRPSGFFSVSMAAADDSDKGRAAAREYIDEFVEGTDWTPTRTVALAGALQYREYDFVTRQVVRQIALQKGLSTDGSHDTVYTDWDELDRFATAVASKVQSTRALVAG